MALVSGSVNQILPPLSTARNSGLEYPDGSVKFFTRVKPCRLYWAILPTWGPHTGAISHPGSATHTLPVLSKATPHGVAEGRAVSRMSGALACAALCALSNTIHPSTLLTIIETTASP